MQIFKGLGAMFPDTSGATDALNYCAQHPTDPKCGAAQSTPFQVMATGWYPKTETAPGQTIVTTTPILATISNGAWYTKWWVLGLIAVASFIGYKKYVAKR